MSYEWDPAKARANFAKHGVRFADVVTVLEDDLALTMRDPSSDEEERWITLFCPRRENPHHHPNR